jgi:hypothetical protein
MTSLSCDNAHLFAGAQAEPALQRLVQLCEAFAVAMPVDEPAQAAGLEDIIARAGEEVRSGALRLADGFAASGPVLRLYKAAAGAGRLKLQLFPLNAGDAHPPHAHYNLVSCQIVLRGRARVREYSLLRRLEDETLEIREELVKTLEPGEGVYTLQRRNNIHWQEGLTAGTVLLNINWRDFFADNPMPPDRSEHGRCYIDWSRARPAATAGTFIVPEVFEPQRPVQ